MIPRSATSRFGVAVVAITLTAAVANAQKSSVRDSAGIRIVYSESPAWTPAQQLRVDPTPSLVIGKQAGEPYELDNVVGAARLSDGRIVVANASTLQLRYYDARGTFLKSAGGRGRGPGEFRQMRSLVHARGDTLAVEGGSGTVNFFDGRGKPVWSVNYKAPPAADLPFGVTLTLAAFANGTTAVTGGGDPSPHKLGERWTERTPLLLVDRKNATIRKFDGLLGWMYVMDKEPVDVRFQPPAASASADDVFYLAQGQTYSINAYGADGRLVRIIRRRWTPTKVTPADIDAFVVEYAKRWITSKGAAAEKERADLRREPYAAAVPAFSQFIVDRDQRLWVRSADLHDAWATGHLDGRPYASSTWSVFGRDGVWLGDVTMPPQFLPRDIGPDYVLGIMRDSDGVQTVVQYRMRTR